MKTLKLINITKTYHNNLILDNLSYEFKSGETYILIGDNGSGKSTIIKIILGLIKPNKGEVYNTLKIGYVPEKVTFNTNIKVVSFLSILNEIRHGQSINIIPILQKWGMLNHSHKRMKELSKGMMQKIMIIQAIMHDPDLIIFDEPLSGLDYNMQKSFIELVCSLSKKQKIIIISTHYPYLFKSVMTKLLTIKRKKLFEITNFGYI